jgi:hypothetical protein
VGASVRKIRPGAVEILRECLARGITGTLSIGPRGTAGLHVHLLHGEVVGAQGPDDAAWLIRRLTNQGALTEKQGVGYTKAVERGQSVDDLLIGQVPDDLYLSQLVSRFRQNLLDLISADEPPRFDADTDLFPSQAQVHHDSAALIDEMESRRDRIAHLSSLPRRSLTLRPGPQMPGLQEEARLLDLADPSITLAELLTFSPFEDGRTLDMVRAMLEEGALVSDQALLDAGESKPDPSGSALSGSALSGSALSGSALSDPALSDRADGPSVQSNERTEFNDFSVEELFVIDDTGPVQPAPAVLDPADIDGLQGDAQDDGGPDSLHLLFDAVLGPLGRGRRLSSGFVDTFATANEADESDDNDWGNDVAVDYADFGTAVHQDPSDVAPEGPPPDARPATDGATEPAGRPATANAAAQDASPPDELQDLVLDDIFDSELLDAIVSDGDSFLPAATSDQPAAISDRPAAISDQPAPAAAPQDAPLEAFAEVATDARTPLEAGVDDVPLEAGDDGEFFEAGDDGRAYESWQGEPILIEQTEAMRPTPSLHPVEEVMVGEPSALHDEDALFGMPAEEDESFGSVNDDTMDDLLVLGTARTIGGEEVGDEEVGDEAGPHDDVDVLAITEDETDGYSAGQASPEVAAALRRAEAEESRREEARDLATFEDDLMVTNPRRGDLFDFGESEDDDELSMFADNDAVRHGGNGQFSLDRKHLDVVDLSGVLGPADDPPVPEFTPSDDDDGGMLEMGDAESVSLTSADKVVALTFSAPRMLADEMNHKLDVCVTVLSRMAQGLDTQQGPGAGQACVQLLLDGAPSVFAVLFHGVEARADGTFDIAQVKRNVGRRPKAEHRRLIDRGIMDLIERGLSYTVEELGDVAMDELLRDIAGYQQRLRDDP